MVADTLNRIKLPTETKEDTEDIDDKVVNINIILNVTLDDNLQYRLNHVWAISFDKLTSDNDFDDDQTVDTDKKH